MVAGRKPAILAAGAAAAIAGCGFGAGPTSQGVASLTVTRDFGAQRMESATETDPPSSETVIRFLDRNADVTTRYGGGFVQSIDGLSGGRQAGDLADWFFYVNGVESPVGSADVSVHGGDRIWWDYRDWSGAMAVPAVVGQWPAPFAAPSAGSTAVLCAAPKSTCRDVATHVASVGGRPEETRFRPGLDAGSLRVLVGPWTRLAHDSDAGALAKGPATSGVFARFDAGGRNLVALDPSGDATRTLGPHTGLVAAVGSGDGPPTWLVTGTDARSVAAAEASLDGADLEERYAVAVTANGNVVPLPDADGSG